jgi:hypothetical protein
MEPPMRKIAIALLIPLLLAADPVADRVAHIRVRHDAALRSAADVYWKMRLTADQAYLSALNAQVRTSPGNADLHVERDAAQAAVDDDSAGLKTHTPLTTAAAVAADIKAAEWRTNMTPAVAKAIADHALLVGMTTDQADEAMGVKGEQASGGDGYQVWTWTQSHEAPMEGGGVVSGMDYGEAGAAILSARANANAPRPRIIDAVWTARLEGGRVVSFERVQ